MPHRRSFLAWLALPPLWAGDRLANAAVPVPPAELNAALPGAVFRGAKRLRVWGFDVYDARLWTLPGFAAERYEAEPFALELGYLRDFNGQAIAERSLKEMRRIGSAPAELQARWLEEMAQVFPDVRRGERLLGVNRPGEGAFFWFNGQPLGALRDAQFARLFFGIWLSPRTPEPALRQALLGMAS